MHVEHTGCRGVAVAVLLDLVRVRARVSRVEALGLGLR